MPHLLGWVQVAQIQSAYLGLVDALYNSACLPESTWDRMTAAEQAALLMQREAIAEPLLEALGELSPPEGGPSTHLWCDASLSAAYAQDQRCCPYRGLQQRCWLFLCLKVDTKPFRCLGADGSNVKPTACTAKRYLVATCSAALEDSSA